MEGLMWGESTVQERTGVLLRMAIALVLLLASSVQPVDAQRSDRSGRAEGGGGYFGVGVAWIDVEDLNDRLTPRGYPAFRSTAVTVGGGGYRFAGERLLIGGEGFAVTPGEEAFDGRSVILGGAHGTVRVGYAIVRTEQVVLFPQFGVGGTGVDLRIGARPTAESFDGVLGAPDRGVRMSRGGLLLDLGAGMDLALGNRPGGILIGARAGYAMVPVQSSWRVENQVIGDGPDTSLAGPYLRFVIGGQGRRR